MVKTKRTAPQLQFQEAMRDTEEQEARQRTIAIHSLRPFCINTEGSRGKKCENPLRESRVSTPFQLRVQLVVTDNPMSRDLFGSHTKLVYIGIS